MSHYPAHVQVAQALCLSLLLLTGTLPAAEDAPFEAEIRAFEAQDKQQMPPEGGVLFVGSSSIRMWESLKEDFPNLPVINRGFGGSQIVDCTRYAERIISPYKPRTIVLYAGDNDIAAGKSPAQVLEDFTAFSDKVRALLPEVRIVFIAIKPSIARRQMIEQQREANELVNDYMARRDAFAYADIFTPMLDADGEPKKDLFIEDGLHLSRKGYDLWAQVLRPAIEGEAEKQQQ